MKEYTKKQKRKMEIKKNENRKSFKRSKKDTCNKTKD